MQVEVCVIYVRHVRRFECGWKFDPLKTVGAGGAPTLNALTARKNSTKSAREKSRGEIYFFPQAAFLWKTFRRPAGGRNPRGILVKWSGAARPAADALTSGTHNILEVGCSRSSTS